MIAAVEVSTHSTRKGAALHLRGCGWSRYLPVVTTVKLTATNAHRCCRNCAKAIRTAIEAARDLNADRTASSHTIRMDRIAVEGRLVDLAVLFPTKAELAHTAEMVERYNTPVYASSGFSGVILAPAVVEDDLLALIDETLSPLGVAAKAAGYRAVKHANAPTHISAKRRLAVANSFAKAA